MNCEAGMKRPVFRYQGSKFRIRRWIISFFPQHKIYVEPFGGGASILLSKKRSSAEVYNDLDSRIVQVFRVLQDRAKAQELAYKLRFTPYAYDEWHLATHEREIPGEDVETARRTIVRSFLSSSSDGATRSGVSGFGAKIQGDSHCSNAGAWSNYPDMIERFCDRLQGVIIQNRDASIVIGAHDRPETLFYVDPPYVKSCWNAGKSYSNELTDANHEELLKQLNGLRGMVLLSGYKNELYQDLLKDWHMEVKQTINQLNQPRTECIWINPAALDRLNRQENLFAAAK